MKDAIHPTYQQAKVHCQGCGREFTVGSTAAEITVELCSNCHPFYTGKQKLVDTAGRVDRFRARQAKAQEKDPKPDAKTAAKPAETTETVAPEAKLAEMKEQMETAADDTASSTPSEPAESTDTEPDSDAADK
jgi:large subunit ribosomal protein L31